MTRTVLSTRLVLILAFVISIHAEQSNIPREAALALNSDFEDGLSDREFRVDFPGVDGSSSAIIKIFRLDDGELDEPKFKYTIEHGAEQAKTLYFKLREKDAPAGSYAVQVCLPTNECSAKRAAFGKVFTDKEKPTLSCIKGNGRQENAFHTFVNDPTPEKFTVEIKTGESFITGPEYDRMPDFVKRNTAYTKHNFGSNPAYKLINGTNVFYTAVWYDGKHAKALFETEVQESPKKYAHEYCRRKYIFWASAHVVDQQTKLVLRRYRGTIIASDSIIKHFILNEDAPSFPVEFARFDEGEEKLPVGTYDISVSFCASDKDQINSSICSQAIYSTLTVA